MDDRHDDLDDGELGAALRHRADELTAPIDLDAAFGDTIERVRSRRRRRVVATTLVAAAAVVAVLVVGIATVGRDDAVVRSPAATSPGPGPTTPVPTAASTTIASTAATTPASTSASAPVTSVPPTAAPGVTAFSSNGGSIEVRLADGQISLAADPVPVSGWSVRVDEDGPDRVRVRFENGSQRSEIRVELVGGTLEHRIIED
jgi:hypothetical protein